MLLIGCLKRSLLSFAATPTAMAFGKKAISFATQREAHMGEFPMPGSSVSAKPYQFAALASGKERRALV
jgi:hypothetical protein